MPMQVRVGVATWFKLHKLRVPLFFFCFLVNDITLTVFPWWNNNTYLLSY